MDVELLFTSIEVPISILSIILAVLFDMRHFKECTRVTTAREVHLTTIISRISEVLCFAV